MESEVVGDQVGEEVAHLDLLCCFVEGETHLAGERWMGKRKHMAMQVATV